MAVTRWRDTRAFRPDKPYDVAGVRFEAGGIATLQRNPDSAVAELFHALGIVKLEEPAQHEPEQKAAQKPTARKRSGK